MITPIRQEPQFQLGQLVGHRRYGYRGVIVARDLFCKATNQWYESNLTQPDRNQPWYHVLVHDSSQVTYAAQSSLRADYSGKPVHHPFIGAFFSEFIDGRYTRNERPFTG